MKCLPKWTKDNEDLSIVNKAIITLVYRGEYRLVGELSTVAKKLQGEWYGIRSKTVW